MGNLTIVLYLALFSIVFNVGAKDVAVPVKEIVLKTKYLGEASYAVPSDSLEIYLKTDRLGTVYYAIPTSSLSTLTTCNLQRENGIAYQLYPVLEGNITDPNIKYKEDCGFEISNFTIGHQGVWILSTEFTDDTGENKSVTQPLLILIEEEVGMIPKDFVTVYEGENLFIQYAEIPDNLTECEMTLPGKFLTSSIEELAERFTVVRGENCTMTFLNVTDELNGLWNFRIFGNVIFSGKLYVTVIMGAKDVAVPVKEIALKTEYLGEAPYAVPSESLEISLTTDRLGTVYYGMSFSPLSTLTTCNLQRENGIAYQLYPVLEGNITDPNIKYKEDCGFEMNNITIGDQGVWILSTEFTDDTGENKSVTQPLLISIEEEVGMIPKDFVTVYEGDDLFIEFVEVPDNVTKCLIIMPPIVIIIPPSTAKFGERFDMVLNNNCTVTFLNVSNDINGQWTFKIIGNMVFSGKLNITVIPNPNEDITPFNPQLDSTASRTFTDPKRLVPVRQNFLRLPAAGREHDGQGNVQLGLPELTDSRTYTYTVNDADFP